MNTYDFAGRVAIVTGGAQGIGRAVVDRLVSGGKVSIWDRDRDVLDRATKELNQPDRVQGLETDIADLAAVEKSVSATRNQFGRLMCSSTMQRSFGQMRPPGNIRPMPFALW